MCVCLPQQSWQSSPRGAARISFSGEKGTPMPELPTTAVRSGLFTVQDVPVPLTGVAIDAEISSFCGRVSVAQRFVNREANPIEAVYVFPLEDGAAVCGFEAIIDGTLVVGEVKERG